MVALADTICRSGVSYPAAIEIARQMTAGASNGNANLLGNVGINASPAIELARQINAAAFSAHKLCLAMWNPSLAKVIKDASGL